MTINLDTMITAAQARADATARSAQEAAGSAMNNFFTPGGTEFKAVLPTLRGSPPAYVGNMNIVPDIKQAFADAFRNFDANMEEGLADYIGQFMPTTVVSNTDSWISNMIVSGGTGIPASIEMAIWERARSRELQDARRVERDALTAFASRGFTMPGGFVANEIMRAQQGAADKSSTLNRDTAIKAVDAQLENIRFAITQGMSIRSTVINALGSFLQAYMAPVQQANDQARILAEAQYHLWSSTAEYYRAMVAEAQLSISTQEINARSHDTLMSTQNASLQRAVELRTNAALGVATVLGNLAAAASSATVSLASQETTAISAL